jgi:hypothetical protein
MRRKTIVRRTNTIGITSTSRVIAYRLRDVPWRIIDGTLAVHDVVIGASEGVEGGGPRGRLPRTG